MTPSRTTAPRLVDFHCHLDLFPDPARAFEDSERSQCLTVTMTTTPRAWRQNCIWAQGKSHVIPSLGLHPELVGTHSHEADLLLAGLSAAKVVGEIGLDGSARYKKSLAAQRKIFCAVVERAAAKTGSVLSIHSRAAVADVLAILREIPSSSQLTPVLHWFAGSLKQLETAIEIGCSFSVNGAMLSSERTRNLISRIPDDCLMTESDAPFRAGNTTAIRDLDIRTTLNGIARLREMESDELASQILENARRVLRLVESK
jgi:TatD DNase family protein